jgi:hypothetical protein
MTRATLDRWIRKGENHELPQVVTLAKLALACWSMGDDDQAERYLDQARSKFVEEVYNHLTTE